METESIEVAEDNFKLDSKTFHTIVIVVAVGMILAGAYLIGSEIYGAKTSCEDKDFVYQFKLPYQHLCNDQPYFKYNTGWNFENEINYDLIFP